MCDINLSSYIYSAVQVFCGNSLDSVYMYYVHVCENNLDYVYTCIMYMYKELLRL